VERGDGRIDLKKGRAKLERCRSNYSQLVGLLAQQDRRITELAQPLAAALRRMTELERLLAARRRWNHGHAA